MEPSVQDEEVREVLRRRYAAAAIDSAGGDYDKARAAEQSCCGPGSAAATAHEGRIGFGGELYGTEAAGCPSEAAVAASLGCGVPTAVAELHAGEIVLDLGSGAGADVLISASRVMPGGHAIGLDMTTEMVQLARRNAAEAGLGNITFVEGYLEHIPLGDAGVDVVISNCVINLSADKQVVLREAGRVLRPGGRLAVSDVLADSESEVDDDAAGAGVARRMGCLGGALTNSAYGAALSAAGFVDIEITETHRVDIHAAAAIIRARKPALQGSRTQFSSAPPASAHEPISGCYRGAVPSDVDDAVRTAHEWFEVNSGWAPPDEDTLADWLADGVCRAPDDCMTEPEGWCEHGLASWWLVLQALGRSDQAH